MVVSLLSSFPPTTGGVILLRLFSYAINQSRITEIKTMDLSPFDELLIQYTGVVV